MFSCDSEGLLDSVTEQTEGLRSRQGIADGRLTYAAAF